MSPGASSAVEKKAKKYGVCPLMPGGASCATFRRGSPAKMRPFTQPKARLWVFVLFCFCLVHGPRKL